MDIIRFPTIFDQIVSYILGIRDEMVTVLIIFQIVVSAEATNMDKIIVNRTYFGRPVHPSQNDIRLKFSQLPFHFPRADYIQHSTEAQLGRLDTAGPEAPGPRFIFPNDDPLLNIQTIESDGEANKKFLRTTKLCTRHGL